MLNGGQEAGRYKRLIAPLSVLFFNQRWSYLGTKEEFAEEVSAITSIDSDILDFTEYYLYVSVSMRMSWQARRETSREEDIAYSLLGLLDVQMPLLYGEGKHAFRRLQEEIMKKSIDQTLFLWHSKRPGVACGILAPHSSNFVTSNYSHNGEHSNASFTISNRGLSIQLQVIDCSNGGVVALIGSLLTPDRIGHRFVTMGIPLRAIWKTNVLTYYRISDPIELSKGHFQRSTFRDLLISLTGQHPPSCWIRFRMAPEVWSAFDFNLMEAKDGQRLHPDKRWRPEDKWWERPPWSPLSKMHWYLIGSLNEYRLSNEYTNEESEYTNEEILLAASKSNPNLRMIIQFGLMNSLEVQEYGQVEPSPFLSCMTHFQIKKPGLKYK
jgi:hypothetical protein